MRHATTGLAVGGLVGLVVGGIGGRLAMLLLRVTSSPLLTGTDTDDGFEIGRFTVGGTLNLAIAGALLGGVAGLVYAVSRGFLPARGRVVAWTAFCGTVGGAAFVHADGVDYLLLRPLWLAVATFTVLPAVGGLAIAAVVERRHARLRMPAVSVIATLRSTRAVRVVALLTFLAVTSLAGRSLVNEASVILQR